VTRRAVSHRVVAAMNRVPSSVARRFPWHSAASRLMRPLLNALLPSEPTVVSVRSGAAANARLLILPRQEKFYWTGEYEREVQAAIRQYLVSGGHFWDVGAHIGFFTLIASRAVGPTGQVHAFEPYPPSRERLRRTIALNELGNVVVHEDAIAAVEGPSVLHAHSLSPMWTLIAARGEDDGVDVRCTTIVALAELLGVPDLIKIDAEGAEVDVLRGALAVLSGDRRPVVIVEFSDRDLLEEARSLLPNARFVSLSDRHWILTFPDHAGSASSTTR
jgi:FkbM family methyltransferase